jgi:hypothetical protein
MDPFWKTFFEEFKERGRNVTPFLVTLPLLLGIVILVEWIGRTPLGESLPSILFGAGALIVGVWVFVAMYRAWGRRSERWERKELSRDELRVARSKLKRDQNRKSA